MPESLQEISGIAFYHQTSDTIYAIQDEDGLLFRLPWNIKKQYHTRFAKKGDYEDLSIMQENVYILKSNGNLYSFPVKESISKDVKQGKEWKRLLPPGEYESLYGDEATGKLYLLCKDCAGDQKNNIVSGFILQAGDSIYQSGTFQINVKELKALAGKIKNGFHPSAMAKNRLTNNWYILSAVNKMLVVTDSSFRVKEVSPLDGNVFNQPEGIAFDTDQNLYISNEGDEFTDGNILKFTRKKGD